MGLLMLVPIIALLAGLLGIAAMEFYALASNRSPYTTYGRGIIEHHPAPAIGVAFGAVGFVGWLTAHLFSCG